MSHGITVADVLLVAAVVGGAVIGLVLLFGLLSLMNPFRSGH